MTLNADLALLAQTAAQHWGGTVTRLIRARENAVFEMALPAGGRAALRLHRPGYQGQAAIRSELWWCAELARAGLPVATPVPAQDGTLLVAVNGTRFASALHWIDGPPLGEAGVPFTATPAQQIARLNALGRLLARVHAVTDTLTLPADFTRPRWDIDGLVGETPFWGRFWDHPALTPENAATLRTARAHLRTRLTDYTAAGADIGPIHADLMRENIIMNDRSLSLIDFDDCGIGFRLYDLGTVLSQNLYEPAFLDLRDALIDGYGETRTVTADLVDLFTLARVLASVGWTMPRLTPDDPIHKSHIARAVMTCERMLSRA